MISFRILQFLFLYLNVSSYQFLKNSRQRHQNRLLSTINGKVDLDKTRQQIKACAINSTSLDMDTIFDIFTILSDYENKEKEVRSKDSEIKSLKDITVLKTTIIDGLQADLLRANGLFTSRGILEFILQKSYIELKGIYKVNNVFKPTTHTKFLDDNINTDFTGNLFLLYTFAYSFSNKFGKYVCRERNYSEISTINKKMRECKSFIFIPVAMFSYSRLSVDWDKSKNP